MAETKLMTDTLSKDERSVLVYAESCLVDLGGLLESVRMNAADHAALDKFQAAGLLTWGRIPSELLGRHPLSSSPTHWVRFTPGAWALAGQLRQRRALQVGPYAQSVFTAVDSRAALQPETPDHG